MNRASAVADSRTKDRVRGVVPSVGVGLLGGAGVFAILISGIAMKVLLWRAGAKVNVIFWNTSYVREYRDFAVLTREEPYPGRLLLRAIQMLFVGGFAASAISFMLSLERQLVG